MIRCHLKEFLARRSAGQKRKAYSVREVAAGAGLPPSVVQVLMKDSFKRIDRKTINCICNYLECQPGDWLSWTQDEEVAGE
jgi:DNA-binding Xre family transcriptional regulator